jgi:ribosomal 50S subunit-recycling heat shock protein
MRLDLFLKASRLSQRRTVAQQLCDAGRVSINGKIVKASHTVKIGEEISLRRGDHLTTVRVLAVPDSRQTSRKDARTLYEILSDQLIE